MTYTSSNICKPKSGTEKALSILLQELISSSPLGCLSTCEAVRALKRSPPPTLRDMPIIRLRKKITDCLTRNPGFDIALDHLRHGIRPRYALRNTNVATGGTRHTQKRSQKSLAINSSSFAHSTKAGDRLLKEAIRGETRKDSTLTRSRQQQNKNREGSSGSHTRGDINGHSTGLEKSVYSSSYKNTPVQQVSPPVRQGTSADCSSYTGTQVHQASPPIRQPIPVYAQLPSTPRFPKVNFPDLTSVPFDILTPPESRSSERTSNASSPSLARSISSSSDLSPPSQFNTIPFPASHSPNDYSPFQTNLYKPFSAHSPYDLSPIQYNLFPLPSPPTSPENFTYQYQLPNLSSDDIFECLNYV